MAVKNVRDRGAVGNPATDTGIINATIQEAVSEGGGVVYFPIGHYYITAPLVIDGHHVYLKGEGSASILHVQGDFDSISINPGLPEQYDNSIEDLSLIETLKSGGKSIVAQRVAQLRIAGVILESPFNGIHIHNFNTVKIDRTRVAGPRGTYGCLLTGGGSSDPRGRSDVIDFYDTVFGGVIQSFTALNYADGKILWRHTYGRISLWTVDNLGNYVSDIQHGPFEGFTALNYADGKILWGHTDGRISLWTVDNQGQHVSDIQHGPFEGFTALNYADGKILWRHTDGRISLWTVDNHGQHVSDIQHGPFEGFTVANYADGKILWRHTDGRISLWTVDNQGQHVSDIQHGPFEGFTALSYADGKILWRHTDGRISLWTVDHLGKHVSDIQHGPFEGFTALNYADGKILWRHTDGRISLWTVDNQGQHVSDIQHHPSPVTSIPDRHGLIIDGAVSTISAHKIYFVNVEGAALWIRNSLGINDNPQFATIYGFEADFPRYEGIRIECGQRFHFTDTQIHASEQRANIVIFEPVNTVSFKGGFSSGAHLAGMDIFGRQVSVQGMDFLSNSGEKAGDWAGIVLEASSRMIAVCGNKCGDPGNVTQSYGIEIKSGADQFAITGNVLFNNSKGGVLNGAGTGRSKVVANNAPDESS